MVVKPLHEAGTLIGDQVGLPALDGRGRPRLVHGSNSTRARATPSGPRSARSAGPGAQSRPVRAELCDRVGADMRVLGRRGSRIIDRDALAGECRCPDALLAVEHRPADVVPQPLVVEYELADRLREPVVLPPALESPCALALSFRRGGTCSLDRIGGRTELASVMVISPRAQARPSSIARRGRGSSGRADSKRSRTCSAHDAAHTARRW